MGLNIDYDESKEKKFFDITHELWGWGRGYHGQLGFKDTQVKWLPAKIPMKKDPRFKKEDHPSRLQMVTCNEKITLLLAVNGMLWWCGDKTTAGFEDPNEKRKHKFIPKDDEKSF